MAKQPDLFEYLEFGDSKFRIEERSFRGLPFFRTAIFIYGDYQGIGATFDTRDDAHDDIVSFVQHIADEAKLGRTDVSHSWSGKASPWGKVDNATRYEEGVVVVGTPSHGGIKLDAAHNRQVPAIFRNQGGWYEEDSEWAKVAVGHPSLFTDRERRQADGTLKNSYPDEYELHYNVVLQPGESRAKDERMFRTDHANDWIGIAAINSAASPGMVEVIASVGGIRGGADEKTFMVPAHEYATRAAYGFVIDQSRHDESHPEEPSSFLGR